jgi:hypothetical protein
MLSFRRPVPMSAFMKFRAAVVAFSVLAGLGPAGSAMAGPVKFSDCKSLNAVYVNGVAKTTKTATHPVPGWIKIKPPVVNTATYTTNKKLDRDGDGIVCEVSA